MNTVIIALGIYLLFLILVSLWDRRTSSLDFIIAGRKLGLWSAASSLSATAIGGGILLVGGAFIYEFGVSGIWYFIGKIIGYALLTRFMNQLKTTGHTEKYHTLADYFFDKVGQKSGFVTASLLVFTYIGWILLGFTGGAQIIQYLTGWEYEIGLLIMLTFILLYVLIGGFKNVVATDAVQWIAMCIIFVLFIFSLSNSFIEIEPEQWRVFGIGPINLISFFLLGVLLPFSNMEVWQRIFALDKNQNFNKTMTLFGVMYFLFGAVLCLVIMLIRARQPGLNPDFAIVQGIAEVFPPVFVGLGTVAFFAAIMSSVDSLLFAATATITHDFLDHNKQHTDKKLQWTMRYIIIVIGIITCILGLWWRDLVDIALYFSAMTLIMALMVFQRWCMGSRCTDIALVINACVAFAALHIYLLYKPTSPYIILVPIITMTFIGLITYTYSLIENNLKKP